MSQTASVCHAVRSYLHGDFAAAVCARAPLCALSIDGHLRRNLFDHAACALDIDDCLGLAACAGHLAGRDDPACDVGLVIAGRANLDFVQ